MNSEKSHSPLQNESHPRGGGLIRDIVFGAHDGIITTFAIVAAVAGAGLSPVVVLILGFANLAADGLSMAFGNYLGTKSEQEFIQSQRKKEEREVEETPDLEREEIRQIYREKGFSGEGLEMVVRTITADKKRWVDVMMKEELGLQHEQQLDPVRGGMVTLLSFSGAGLIPLLAYVFPAVPIEQKLFAAVILTGLALFGVGAARTWITKTNPVAGGMEMLFIGAIAAGVAYGLGYGISRLLDGAV